MPLPVYLRWSLLPIASIAACSGTVVLADAVVSRVAAGLSREGAQAIEAVLPVEARAGLLYGIAALAFVLAGTAIAPRARPVVALLLYGLGACLAWWGLGDWYIPEGYPRAYQPSHVPLALALAGGIIGVLMVLLRAQRRRSPSASSRPAS